MNMNVKSRALLIYNVNATFFWKTSSLGNLDNAPFFPCGWLDILHREESRIPLIVIGIWRE